MPRCGELPLQPIHVAEVGLAARIIGIETDGPLQDYARLFEPAAPAEQTAEQTMCLGASWPCLYGLSQAALSLFELAPSEQDLGVVDGARCPKPTRVSSRAHATAKLAQQHSKHSSHYYAASSALWKEGINVTIIALNILPGTDRWI
jgi:hypothetical protein